MSWKMIFYEKVLQLLRQKLKKMLYNWIGIPFVGLFTSASVFCSLSESFFMVKGAALFLQQGGATQEPKTPTHHKHAGKKQTSEHNESFWSWILHILYLSGQKDDSFHQRFPFLELDYPCLFRNSFDFWPELTWNKMINDPS